MTTTTSTTTTTTGQWLRRILFGTALVILLLHFIVYLLYTGSLLRFPFDYDEGEGYEIQNSVWIGQGQWPYFNNDVFPFYGTNYPPLFHILMMPLVKLLGPAYWYGRLIVSLCTLATAVAIGYAVERDSGSRRAAWLAGLAFLASNIIYHIGPLYRQHMVMVMFEALAVITIAGFDTIADAQQRRRRIALAILFLLCAGFTKQMAFVTCIAVFGYMFLRGPKRAILWGLGSAAIAVAIFAWIYFTSHGWFWFNVITANIYEYLIWQFRGLLQVFIGLHGALLLLAIALFLYELYIDRLSVYALWLVAGSINGVLAGKWGAGDSYYAETIGAICILAGIFLGRSLNSTWRLPAHVSARWRERLTRALPLLSTLALILFILYGLAVIKLPLHVPGFSSLAQLLNIQSNTKFPQFYDSAGWTHGYATIGQMPSDEDIANGWKIVDLVKDDPQHRPLLSEEAAFNFHTNTPVLTNPPHIKGLYDGKHYDPTALVNLIETHQLRAIIVRAAGNPRDENDIVSLWPLPITEAAKKAYNIAAVVPMNGFYYIIMKPDPAWLADPMF